MKLLQKSQKRATHELGEAKSRLQQRRDEIIAKEGSAESEAAMRTQRLKEAEEKFAALNKTRDELKQATTDSYRAYEELEPHVIQARQNCQNAESKLNSVEQRLRGLQSSTGNSVAMFGQRCPKVKNLVSHPMALLYTRVACV